MGSAVPVDCGWKVSKTRGRAKKIDSAAHERKVTVNEPDVLRLAADILQRKVTTVVTGAVDKTATRPIVEAIVNCGALLNTIESLRDLANVFDGNAGEQ